MCSGWRVTWQYIGEEKVFQVYRLRDINKVNHSGNREYRGGIMHSEEEAMALVSEINRNEVSES